MKFELYGKVYEVEAYKAHYQKEDGPLAIELIDTADGCAFCTLTVNICDGMAHDNYTYIDTNNVPNAVEFIRKNRLGVFTGIYGYSGYCQYPLYMFDPKALERIEEAH